MAGSGAAGISAACLEQPFVKDKGQYPVKKHLEKIDLFLKANHVSIYDSLQRPATNSEIQVLRDTCFGGGVLPEKLEVLYRWHNGQAGSGSVNPLDNRTFMPIANAIDTWTFLNDPMQDILEPWSGSWFPLFENGAGDHVVFECGQENHGALISYWHDDPARAIVYADLAAWSEAIIDGAR